MNNQRLRVLNRRLEALGRGRGLVREITDGTKDLLLVAEKSERALKISGTFEGTILVIPPTQHPDRGLSIYCLVRLFTPTARNKSERVEMAAYLPLARGYRPLPVLISIALSRRVRGSLPIFSRASMSPSVVAPICLNFRTLGNTRLSSDPTAASKESMAETRLSRRCSKWLPRTATRL